MKKELVMLIAFAVVLAIALVVVSWHFGNQNGRLAAAQETTGRKVIDVEARLLPLERDLERRRGIRTKALAVVAWVRGKIGV